MTFDIRHPADRRAVDACLAVQPHWTGMLPAADVPGMQPNWLLHAGPAFDDPDSITAPVFNSARVSAVFEGLAADFDEAGQKIRAGDIVLRPAQDLDVVTPLAAVVSASMLLHVVADASDDGRRAFAPVNGGNGVAPRLGLCSDDALAHLRFLYGTLAPALARVVQQPVDLVALARAGIEAGDDCHGRTPQSTAALVAQLRDALAVDGDGEACLRFLDDGPSFFLNLWMAACKCLLLAARGIDGASVVITAGANGAATGIQLAGAPGRWLTEEAVPPNGRLDGDVDAARALGAIGDSAIVDACGFGAMAMRHAPEQAKAMLAFMPADGMTLSDRLLSGRHPGFGDLDLPLVMTARACVETGTSPVVSLGILDRAGTAGRLGGGIFTQPADLFRRGMLELPD